MAHVVPVGPGVDLRYPQPCPAGSVLVDPRGRRWPAEGLQAKRGGYAHVVIVVDREANVDGLWVSFAFEIASPARPAAVLARLEVDLPDGSALVAVDLNGDEVARLLAGETLALPGYVAPAALIGEQPAEPEQLDEPLPGGEVERLAEPAPGGDQAPEVPAGEYGPKLDEPPAGTEPITRPAQLVPPERVVTYLDGRWRAGLVISRDRHTALVAYVVDGPFGDRLRRVTFDRVRRLVDDDG